MAIRVQWANDNHTLLRFQFDLDWRWDDLYPAVDEAFRLAGERLQEIDAILEFPAARDLPPGNVLFHARRILDRMPPWQGRAVLVCDQPLLRKVASLVNQIYRSRFTVVVDLQEAQALIALDRQLDAPASFDASAQAVSPAR